MRIQTEYLKNKKYIDLTPFFTNQGIDKEHVHIGFDGSLKINDETYYIKKPETEYRLLGELIAAKLLDKLNLPHVEYHLAQYFDDVVLLSKSFKKENNRYISGQRILNDYGETLKTPQDVSDLNNLEQIWQALEYRYSKSNTPEQTLAIVSQLMAEITTLLSFDFVVGNIDRHQSNWIVEEGPQGIHLAQIFDNEYLLDAYLDPETIASFAMASSYEELERFASPRESIDYYVNISSEEFVIKLKQIQDKLSLPVFAAALRDVEEDLGCRISSEIKLKMLSSYQKQQNLVSKTIAKYYNQSFSI